MSASMTALFPRRPLSCRPQQNAAPSFRMAQLCWKPALIDVNLSAEATAEGAVTAPPPITLLPSRPFDCSPQQNARLSTAVMPQLCNVPELIAKNFRPPGTAVGVSTFGPA